MHQNNSNYGSQYIYDRLLTSALTANSTNTSLVSNKYGVYSGNQPAPINGLPHEQDWVNYGPSMIYRGNVTQLSTPGKTINTQYDYTGNTGTVTSQDDNNGHSVGVVTSQLTNFTMRTVLLPTTPAPCRPKPLTRRALPRCPSRLPAKP